MKNIVSNWFGDSYKELHPLIQKLHNSNSNLTGKVQLDYGKGIAKLIGERLGRKLGLPDEAGIHDLNVIIKQKDNQLVWTRIFNQKNIMTSRFIAIGNYPNGYWIEKTGKIIINLNVQINDGGWYWQPKSYQFYKILLPKWLFPATKAYKKITNDQYEFVVSFNAPIIGKLLSYQGILNIK